MEERTCPCGGVFEVHPKGGHATYCSPDCRREAQNQRRPPQIVGTTAVCVVCNARFARTSANQTCCPPTAADRARVKGQPRSKCARRLMREQARAMHTEVAQCPVCDTAFERVTLRIAGTLKVYCSDTCHREAKHRRYLGVLRGPRGPVVARVQFPPEVRPHDIARYKRSLRADPCAYCGIAPPVGVDHIEPTGSTGDRKDWTNMTGCCKRCNETKSTLPLLMSLPWIPLSRAYHDTRRVLFAA